MGLVTVRIPEDTAARLATVVLSFGRVFDLQEAEQNLVEKQVRLLKERCLDRSPRVPDSGLAIRVLEV